MAAGVSKKLLHDDFLYSRSARSNHTRPCTEKVMDYYRPALSCPGALPEPKIKQWPAITAIVVGILSLIIFGGLGVTGLLHSYEVIHLSPSWITSIIEAIGNTSHCGGLWAITGVGALGGGVAVWGIYQKCKFNEEANAIQEVQNQIQAWQNQQEKLNALLAQFSTEIPEVVLLPETIAVVERANRIQETPVNCYIVLWARGSTRLYAVNYNGTFYYHTTPLDEFYHDFGEQLLALGFQYYDLDAKMRFPTEAQLLSQKFPPNAP